ncbi:hypothetical protein FHU41_000710 [Psychromicrobium silvestre]|uniref:Lipoprotein LprG n=1 Tax=Psychromicrobium silvestre TaxID=1645614 RepID=A0A7Y9S4N6_9MICC|nr:hypothetical protein [Psychromicrobium silvestre]NYE94489.1 hypothetical protein [Psychromicrobium silvestre]
MNDHTKTRHSAARAAGVVALAVVGFLLAGCTPQASTPATSNQSTSELTSTSPVTASASATPNGIEKLNGSDIVAQTITNALVAKSVHLTGSFTAPASANTATPSPTPAPHSEAVTIDLTGSATKFTATFIVGDRSIEMRRLNNVIYMKTNQQAALQLGEPRLAQGFVKYGVEDPMVKSWLAFTDAPTMIKNILQADVPGLTYTTGSVTTSGNVPAIQALITENNRLAGTLLVATTGKPYPLRLTMADETGTADFTMTGWAMPPVVTTPAANEMAP